MIRRTILLGALLAGCEVQDPASTAGRENTARAANANTAVHTAATEVVHVDPAAVERLRVRHPEGIGAALRGESAPTAHLESQPSEGTVAAPQGDEFEIRRAAHLAGGVPRVIPASTVSSVRASRVEVSQ